MTTPDDRRRRTNKTILIATGCALAVIALIVAVGALAGSEQTDAADAAPVTTTAVAVPPPAADQPSPVEAPPPCYPYREPDDPELTAFTDSLALPDGVQVVNGLIGTDSDYGDQVGVSLHLCVPETSDAESLRPIATDIAKALRATPLGDRTYALRISDVGPDFNTEAMIKVTRYSWHMWNGKPSPQSELDLWEVVHA